MGFNQPATLNLPASTDIAVTVFRQATYPVWADQAASYVGYADGQFHDVGTPATPASSDVTLIPKPGYYAHGNSNRTASASLAGVTGASGTSIMPYALFGADIQGAEYVYVPANGLLSVIVYSTNAFANAANATVTLEMWSSSGETSTYPVSLTIAATYRGGQVTTAVATGWIRIASVSLATTGTINASCSYQLCAVTGSATYTASTTNAGTLALGVSSTAIVHLPLVYPVEFANSTLPWFSTRTTASALLGTNVSQVLNKGGTVLGGRISPAVYNAWQVPKSYVNGLHPAEKAYLPLETGVYTYCPPSTDLVFFHDYTLNTTNGAPSAPVFRLDNDAMYNKMFITASGVAETLACTCSWHIEFRTSSALFQVGLSAMTLESLHSAQLVLAENGFYFENPQHDGLLNKVISTAKKYAPQAAQLVGAVNPVAGKIMQSLISRMAVIPKQGPSKPPATSAQGSGIVGEKRTAVGNMKKKRARARAGKGKKK